MEWPGTVGGAAVLGAGIVVAGGVAKSGDRCDKAAYDLQMRRECKAISQEQGFRELNGQDIAVHGIQREMYDAKVHECIEKGYLTPITELQQPDLNGGFATPIP